MAEIESDRFWLGWIPNGLKSEGIPKPRYEGFCDHDFTVGEVILFNPYCWWTKSCTTKGDNYPIIFRVLPIPGGAGFLPSTVSLRSSNRQIKQDKNNNPTKKPQASTINQTKPLNRNDPTKQNTHHLQIIAMRRTPTRRLYDSRQPPEDRSHTPKVSCHVAEAPTN